MKTNVNLYGEELIINTPKTLKEFKQEISKCFMLDMEDVNELKIFSKKIGRINNEETYLTLIKSNEKEIQIDLEIDESSKLYKGEEKKIIKELETKDNLEKEKEKKIKEEKERKEKELKEKLEKNLPVHKHYWCNQCRKGPIKGIRYNCLICKDFDFCEECESKYGQEHGHPLLKIRRPELAPFIIKAEFKK
ncbi:MAG: hypothetical protein MJ252_26005 [archaeon]|nr:hypothetical protein [archaeon]